MNLADMTQESIGGFAEELGKIEIKQIEIPKFSIPNWPKDIVARGLLGKRNYCVPALGNNNLLEWRGQTQNLIPYKQQGGNKIRFSRPLWKTCI